jgi:hypothetical protein
MAHSSLVLRLDDSQIRPLPIERDNCIAMKAFPAWLPLLLPKIYFVSHHHVKNE